MSAYKNIFRQKLWFTHILAIIKIHILLKLIHLLETLDIQTQIYAF